MPVHVDVHEASQLAALVEEEVGDRQRPERLSDRRRRDLEATAAAGLGREERRQEDYGQEQTSTEKTGGSWLAASSQVSPASGETKTDPLCVPR